MTKSLNTSVLKCLVNICDGAAFRTSGMVCQPGSCLLLTKYLMGGQYAFIIECMSALGIYHWTIVNLHCRSAFSVIWGIYNRGNM